MIGRATFGRPWIFKEIRDYLDGKPADTTLDINKKIDILKEQLDINIKHIREEHGPDDPRNELRAILHTRRHLAASPIFKGIPDFRKTRIALLRAETKDELNSILEAIRTLLNN